jgi:hypothetical protein
MSKNKKNVQKFMIIEGMSFGIDFNNEKASCIVILKVM